MNVIIVYIGKIMYCPPALSLVQILCHMGIETVLCTIGSSTQDIEKSIGKDESLRIELVGENYESEENLTKKFFRMQKIKKATWKIIEKYYNEDTAIWIVSEGSLKHLGKKILEKRYILHLLELNEGIYYISGNPLIKMNYKIIAKNASVLVEAEYNRAHITKAWWGLTQLPEIFPNKPFNLKKIPHHSEISSSEHAAKIMKRLKGKKIILYQGNMSKERPIEEYIKAVGELGDDYAFIMMIAGTNPYSDLKYSNFYCIPFINPPFHLEITSHAYIGILSYSPIKNDYSILNTLYCAPNKIWEYSKFGIPMISNDLPALKQMFDKYKNGICLNEFSKERIINAIKQIENEYEAFKNASYSFYDSVDLIETVKRILEKARNN